MEIRTNRLLELRIESGKSQEVVSGFVYIAQATYSAYENGRPIPSDKLIRIAQYFNVSIDYLLGLTDERRDLSHQPKVPKQRIWQRFIVGFREKTKLLLILLLKH